MSTTKMMHTPGPWKRTAVMHPPDGAGSPICSIIGADGIWIADVLAAQMPIGDADARLIAAAPDAHRILYRLGQALRDGGEPSLHAKMDSGETIADAIEAYLRKAEAE